MYFSLMNDTKYIDMRNDIIHANIITTCLRQYLLTIGVGPTEMVFSGITFLTTLAAHQGTVACCVTWH